MTDISTRMQVKSFTHADNKNISTRDGLRTRREENHHPLFTEWNDPKTEINNNIIILVQEESLTNCKSSIVFRFPLIHSKRLGHKFNWKRVGWLHCRARCMKECIWGDSFNWAEWSPGDLLTSSYNWSATTTGPYPTEFIHCVLQHREIRSGGHRVRSNCP